MPRSLKRIRRRDPPSKPPACRRIASSRSTLWRSSNKNAVKLPGIIGGIAPESTIDYYRSIVAEFRSRKPDGSYPELIINSINMTKMIGMIAEGNLSGTADYLAAEIDRVAAAGADFA